jgi:hypothetical protein
MMRWAREFALWCTDRLAEGADLHIADTDTQEVANAVLRALTKAGGRMRHRDLLRALGYKFEKRHLADVLKSLEDAERIAIEKVKPPGPGRPSE